MCAAGFVYLPPALSVISASHAQHVPFGSARLYHRPRGWKKIDAIELSSVRMALCTRLDGFCLQVFYTQVLQQVLLICVTAQAPAPWTLGCLTLAPLPNQVCMIVLSSAFFSQALAPTSFGVRPSVRAPPLEVGAADNIPTKSDSGYGRRNGGQASLHTQSLKEHKGNK